MLYLANTLFFNRKQIATLNYWNSTFDKMIKYKINDMVIYSFEMKIKLRKKTELKIFALVGFPNWIAK